MLEDGKEVSLPSNSVVSISDVNGVTRSGHVFSTLPKSHEDVVKRTAVNPAGPVGASSSNNYVPVVDPVAVKNNTPIPVGQSGIMKEDSNENPATDPIKTTDVKPDVVASAKGFVVQRVVGIVESNKKIGSEKPRSDSGTVSLDNLRSDKALGQSSMNVAYKNIVDKIIFVLISQILGNEPKFDVVMDVTTSLAQTDHPIETPLEKSYGKYDSESVSIKSSEKSIKKDDYDSMSVDTSEKEENDGVKKDQSTNFVNVDDLDSDDEPIGRRLAPEITKRLKSRKWKFVESTSKSPKAPKKSTSVNPSNGLDLERELGKDYFECKEVMDLIKEVGLMKSVAGFGKCYEMLVKELIVNISKDCNNKRSKEFRKVYVRGKCVEFSPEFINRFIGRSEEEQAKVEVKEWPRKWKLSVGSLSVKYEVLHTTGDANWVLTNHTSNIATWLGKFIYTVGTKTKFDFGSYVFYQSMKHTTYFAIKMPIAFPSLICGVVLSQHLSILISSDVACKRESPISLHYRLFTGKHVLDIVMTSGKKCTSSTARKLITVELKHTCKNLDETIKSCTGKKGRLEILINALSEEDVEGNLDGDKEEYNEVEEDVDASGDDVEDITSSNDD
ncbi:uncharacterized protein LOC127103331 [Lathyrus oleraceus]|uniref:uncharacterized protein LOC127103331 n=1 Tax=Pisum sativum TaxID=3888 RepID=UPI0021D3206F|nr:uncharacterized protein LOC127103331 [Pisum sativum]